MLTVQKLLEVKDSFTVTYIVKNSSSRDKLRVYLKETGRDPIHRIFVDKEIAPYLKAGEIGYRLECPAIINKDKNGRVIP